MSYLKKQMDFLRFDKRLLEINLKNGTLTQTEFDQYINQLKDSASNAEKLELTEDNDSSIDSMNGGSHPAETTTQANETKITPPNSDPFGSGF